MSVLSKWFVLIFRTGLYQKRKAPRKAIRALAAGVPAPLGFALLSPPSYAAYAIPGWLGGRCGYLAAGRLAFSTVGSCGRASFIGAGTAVQHKRHPRCRVDLLEYFLMM